MRLDSADIPPELQPLFGPITRVLMSQAPLLLAEQLLDNIEKELASIHARVRESWRDRVAGSIGDNIDLELRVGELEVEAFVEPSRIGDRATIQFSLGTIFALDDLSLYVLTLKPVLVPDRTALAIGEPAENFEPPGPLAVAGARLSHARRFVDYRGALDGGINRPILTYAMACAPWRLAQASIVSELALAWVLFHERAHWALGHLDLVEAIGVHQVRLSETLQNPIEGLGVSARPTQGPRRKLKLNSGSHRVLEGQADSHAFLLLCDYAMRVGGAGERYEAIARSFGVPDDPRALRRMTFGVCLRLCITAVSVACVAFHEARKGRTAQTHSSHPAPAARLLNMLVNSLLVTPMCKQDESGQWIIRAEDRTDEHGNDTEAFRDFTEAGVAMGLTDLMVITNAFGADFNPIDPGDGSPSNWTRSAWLHDLTSFWVTEGSEQAPCTTAAGKEIARLRRIEKMLQPRLDQLQVQRFGRLLSLELGDVWRENSERHEG